MNPWPLLGALIAALTLVVGGYGFGHRVATNAAAANQAKAIAQAHARYIKAAEGAQLDAAAATAEQQALRARYADLKRSFAHHAQNHPPLLAQAAGCGPGLKLPGVPASPSAPIAEAAQGGHPGAPGAQPGPGPGPAPGQAPGPGGDPGGLTGWAVWMWNSSLAGRDLPAGACGAADPTHPACAVGTGLDLDDAWANHAANAETCALDRARHQRLIDHIQRRQAPGRHPANPEPGAPRG